MKHQFVENLQEGDQINDYFLAVRKDLRTQQSGSKFLGMVFKDRSGEIGGILWNNAVAIARVFEVGDVVKIRGSVGSYQDRLQIRVEQVLPMRDGEYDNADLVFVPDDTDETVKAFRDILETIEDEHLRRLVHIFLDDDALMRRFAVAAAGKRWHHAYPGGLVRHCYEMARIADVVSELYPKLSRDILLTGVLLHDIGKLDEMSHDMVVEYTDPGKLLGHLTIGMMMAQRAIDQIDGFPETLRLQVLHCILSHHGELANGSPITPRTLEATVLYHIDNLGAQASAIDRVADEARDRGQRWSDYLPNIERQIWTKEL